MKKSVKTFCFDIDNIICSTDGLNYQKSKPYKQIINMINKLYRDGHEIKIFTARYMGRNNENIIKANKQGYKKTFNQLKKWKLKFHKLFLCKPTFDVYVDDKAFGLKKNWYKLFRKKYL